MTWSDLGSERWTYEKGLHELGNGAYAWLQPDGGWGWSNAGLLVADGESLLVDTLFDLAHTRDMLAAMRASEPRAAASIGTLVNTHANGDHCFGNQLVEGAEVIASVSAAEEMLQAPPDRLAALMRQARADDSEVSRYLVECFGPFDFEGIAPPRADTTFERQLTRHVGGKRLELIEVGPAHTGGDILVHVPEDRLVFTGDILFVEGTPILWAGPVQNWLDACDRILAMDVDVIVPGHGPITDQRGPRAVKAYLEYVRDEAKRRFDAGLDARQAALDIALGDFSSWGDAERIAVNVDTLYREFQGSTVPTDVATLFARMAEIRQNLRRG